MQGLAGVQVTARTAVHPCHPPVGTPHTPPAQTLLSQGPSPPLGTGWATGANSCWSAENLQLRFMQHKTLPWGTPRLPTPGASEGVTMLMPELRSHHRQLHHQPPSGFSLSPTSDPRPTSVWPWTAAQLRGGKAAEGLHRSMALG